MAPLQSLNPDYFEKVYEANDDPWNFETSDYERGKYAATLAALPKEHYQNALEIGCSIGVLTALLAKHCGHLLSIDVSQKALDAAAARCKDLENTAFQRRQFPGELPAGRFDLIMVSEVAYYLSPADWQTAMRKLYEGLLPGGNICLVHWLPVVPDYPQTGDEVHHSFADIMDGKLQNVFSSRAESYRIDVWEKVAGE